MLIGVYVWGVEIKNCLIRNKDNKSKMTINESKVKEMKLK